MGQTRIGRRGARAAKTEWTKKGAETRQRIIAASAALIFEQGVATTTLEQMRDAAGVSNSQIYHYFADKEELVRAVIAYLSETVVGGQEPMLAEIGTIEGLHAWCNFLVAHQRSLNCRGGCPIGSIGSELAELDPEARQEAARAMTRWQGAIRAGLQAMHARGDLVDGIDPDHLATATLAAVQGALLLTQLQRSTAPLEATLAMVIDHIERLSTAKIGT
jgi:AcrR family transcriptional regulator